MLWASVAPLTSSPSTPFCSTQPQPHPQTCSSNVRDMRLPWGLAPFPGTLMALPSLTTHETPLTTLVKTTTSTPSNLIVLTLFSPQCGSTSDIVAFPPSLRYNLHTITFTHFECLVRRVLVVHTVFSCSVFVSLLLPECEVLRWLTLGTCPGSARRCPKRSHCGRDVPSHNQA